MLERLALLGIDIDGKALPVDMQQRAVCQPLRQADG
ncbi:hypothetical protein N788_11450 [Arenimonas donghaensis DSM 18148 = HO3-R19]|uniref:Uncharacterized protein n=1 Tax=Arenimonas donghaensis DSM 18148 = HO3-R19 TaxID=1121014 RepID=A0A087MJT1_9GAMM|nr:hypothetical protein N788_11450 [Arenimonas donghaensis DSM 18148 = HO3-R19]